MKEIEKYAKTMKHLHAMSNNFEMAAGWRMIERECICGALSHSSAVNVYAELLKSLKIRMDNIKRDHCEL